MSEEFLSLDKISAYTRANKLSDSIWEEVFRWESFGKQTVGGQFIRAIESIGANIAEGFGRYHKKDKQKFFYNARGSVYESIFWIEKAQKRKLIASSLSEIIQKELFILPREINWLIKITEEKLKI